MDVMSLESPEESPDSNVRFCLRLKEPDRNPKVFINRICQRLQHPATKEPSYAFRSQYSRLSPEHPQPPHQGTARCSTYSCVPTATERLEDFWSSCRSMSLCCVSLNGLRRLKGQVRCW